MKHVMKNNLLPRKDTTFYKIIGRIFVEDFKALHHAHNNKRIVSNIPAHMERLKHLLLSPAGKETLLVKDGEGSVSTAFYKHSVQYYVNNLINRFRRVDDPRGYYREHTLLVPLMKRVFDACSIHPSLAGYSASQDRLYEGVDYPNEVKELATLFLRKEAKGAGLGALP
jgi:hypothetical protein